MGVSASKIEEDKALLLCRERKRFVRQALDGRCALAAAHLSYIKSLRNTGTVLRKFVEPEVPSESSLYTSTSATPEPLASTEKSISQFSYSSPSPSQRVETVEHLSPTPSPLSSGRIHINYMKAGRSSATTIEKPPPIPLTATLQPSSSAAKHPVTQLDENSFSELPQQAPGTPPWDFFHVLHPIESQFSFEDGRALSHGLDNADDIRRLREEEGIPELEEEGENASTNGQDDFADSEDDFEQPSNENLVRMFKNRNEVLNSHTTDGSLAIHPEQTNALETEQRNGEKTLPSTGTCEADETPQMTPSVVALPINGKEKESGSESKLAAKDFISSMKEIEDLFLRAAESGKEVPRMLEANKLNFRPLVPAEIAPRSKASTFLTSCFSCCTEEVQLPQVNAAHASNDMKYLTWHKSASSLSSSSRIPLATISKDGSEDLDSNVFGSGYMNSGSHASTLDRLYAWERKLYDEVKASGIIRRAYDMKCRMLRHEESKAENPYKIDKIRATVKDLHSRIRVAIHRIDSISKTIEEIRDKELEPQLEELIGGLFRMWVMMLDCHKQQFSIISVACNGCSTRVSIHSESHRQATFHLEFELNSLCTSFTKWISTHKSYLQAINSWLHKCVLSLKRKSSRRRKNEEFDPEKDRAPPIFVTCQKWLLLLNNLPTKDVEDAIKSLVAVTTDFMPREEKNRGNSKLSFSLPRKGGVGEVRDEIGRKEAPVDWSLNLDRLQSTLVTFLDHLQTFAAKSVEQYETLQKAINTAKAVYEKN